MDRRSSKLGGKMRGRPALSGPAVVAAAILIGLCAGVCRAQGTSTTTTTTTSSNEPAFIKNLHITGYYQNTSATWVNSGAMEYNLDRWNKLNRNSLASERQLLQIDVNDDFTENDSMFMRSWFVYEPNYPWETGCLNANPLGAPTFAVRMHCTSDFYNQYGIRELWFKHRWGPLQFFVGRQIVTWGESIAFRVGDQINPQDTSYAFGFSNLEQSRTPLWMIHPILNLPSAGPFSSNFAELVYIPGFDFLYTQVDQPGDAFDGLNNIAGRVNISGEDPGGRFGARLDNRVLFSGVAEETAPPFAMVQAGVPVAGCVAGCLYLSAGSGVQQVIPNATWGNSQIGIRLHTLVENAEVTAFWLWNHDYSPVARINNRVITVLIPGALALRRVDLFYPQYQAVGFTVNRPLYLPGALAQLPFVIRAETLYKNHDAFNTFAVPGTPATGFAGIGVRNFSPSAVTRSDTIQWLFALDLDSAYTPWLTTTGNLTANYELTDTTILSFSKNMQGGAGFFEHKYHNDIAMLISVGTSWWWGAISPNWTTEYAPEGLTFLSFPSIQLTPPWTNKYFMKLEWVDVQGTNKFGLDGGVFKGKDLIFAQFQYNFSLM
ncbi:MAG TPA: DUF1302 family protein [Candidatus Binataceae bacterium]|nr:DUF1302 family protein [Candidatus Binataceae bacterium]